MCKNGCEKNEWLTYFCGGGASAEGVEDLVFFSAAVFGWVV
jgi:hypothetical protein